ncbi:hypothetical protein DAPPUDRAFT_300254 [Daphnia pulex]|uniref:Uncharacterized protein n=1 Tax=Daphnia pulex TaxID=6669 RepID=E9G5Q5_DAPPU|nr:hypothetical protein DAPPUDRAFT_300254 [Daphnia pulex]|eukprot:EFX85250.1 hypothetical protein DAPPUDRAFT_300254 [Daphnia pulex]
MSSKVLSILALVVLVCVLTTAANPAAEGNVTETAAHHKKSEHGWKKKKHAAAERRNTTPTHYHHGTIRKMKEDKEPAKETVKTKRDAIEDYVHFDYDKWLKDYKADLEAFRLHMAKELANLELANLERLEAVQVVADLAEVEPAPLPAEEITTLVDLESVVVQAVDPAALAVVVKSAAPASAEESAPLPAFGKDQLTIAVEEPIANTIE